MDRTRLSDHKKIDGNQLAICTLFLQVNAPQRTKHQENANILSISIFSGVFGSGLCLLSKYPIVTTLFHAWSVNGYVHRIQHGDWFGGKGVGLCQILANGYPVNIYIAHVRSAAISTTNTKIKLISFSFMLNMIARVTIIMRIVSYRHSIRHNLFNRHVVIQWCKCWLVI